MGNIADGLICTREVILDNS